MEIIALQQYTDNKVSLYEGQIRNIENNLANKLIEKGIVAEHSTSNQSGIFITEITPVFDPQNGTISEATLSNTWQEIYDAMKTGIVFGKMEKRLNDTAYATSLVIIMVVGTDGETYFVETASSGMAGFEADTPNDYPVMTTDA